MGRRQHLQRRTAAPLAQQSVGVGSRPGSGEWLVSHPHGLCVEPRGRRARDGDKADCLRARVLLAAQGEEGRRSRNARAAPDHTANGQRQMQQQTHGAAIERTQLERARPGVPSGIRVWCRQGLSESNRRQSVADSPRARPPHAGPIHPRRRPTDGEQHVASAVLLLQPAQLFHAQRRGACRCHRASAARRRVESHAPIRR